MILFITIASLGLLGILGWLAVLLRRWVAGTDYAEIPLPEADSKDPLVNSIRTLANRVTLNEEFSRVLKRIIGVLIVGGLATFVLGIAVGALALETRHVSNEREHDLVADRTAACIQFNVQQEKDRSAIANGIINAFKPLVTTADGQAGLVKLDANLHQQVDQLLPYRDCSAAGIDTFLKNPPPDPASSMSH